MINRAVEIENLFQSFQKQVLQELKQREKNIFHSISWMTDRVGSKTVTIYQAIAVPL